MGAFTLGDIPQFVHYGERTAICGPSRIRRLSLGEALRTALEDDFRTFLLCPAAEREEAGKGGESPLIQRHSSSASFVGVLWPSLANAASTLAMSARIDWDRALRVPYRC